MYQGVWSYCGCGHIWNLRDGALHVNSASAGATWSGRVVPVHPCGRELENPLARRRPYDILVHSSNHLPGTESNTIVKNCQWPEDPCGKPDLACELPVRRARSARHDTHG